MQAKLLLCIHVFRVHTMPSSKRKQREWAKQGRAPYCYYSIFIVRWCICTNVPEPGIHHSIHPTTPLSATCYLDSSSDDERRAQAMLSIGETAGRPWLFMSREEDEHRHIAMMFCKSFDVDANFDCNINIKSISYMLSKQFAQLSKACLLNT